VSAAAGLHSSYPPSSAPHPGVAVNTLLLLTLVGLLLYSCSHFSATSESDLIRCINFPEVGFLIIQILNNLLLLLICVYFRVVRGFCVGCCRPPLLLPSISCSPHPGDAVAAAAGGLCPSGSSSSWWSTLPFCWSSIESCRLSLKSSQPFLPSGLVGTPVEFSSISSTQQ